MCFGSRIDTIKLKPVADRREEMSLKPLAWLIMLVAIAASQPAQ
jgi:hypothetical protein